MGKVLRGIKNKKGKFVEREVEEPNSLYKADALKIIGKEHWKEFDKWMIGQGAPEMSDGSLGYFDQDVQKYKRNYIFLRKCSTCNGFGLWAIGDPSPMGGMDAADGCPVKKCPECGANGIPKNTWRTLDGRYIPIKELEDDHLKNIIKHIKERKLGKIDEKILKKMLAERKRRKLK